MRKPTLSIATSTGLLAAGVSLVAACTDATPTRLGPTAPDAPTANRAAAAEQPTDEYVVSYRESAVARGQALGAIATTAAAAAAEGAGVTVVRALEFSPAVVVRTTKPDALLRDPRVRSVVPNRRMRTMHQVNQQNARYVLAGWQWDMRQIKVLPTMAADGRTTLPVSGAGSKVCIIDSGIDPNHQEFAGKIIASRNFFDYTSQALDSVGHGTHVAGTVTTALRTNIASMAPGAQLLVAKVFGNDAVATDAGFWDAYGWCGAMGADAVNMSFGFNGGLPIAGNEAYIAEELVRLQSLAATGAVITASAGNDNRLFPVAGRIWLPSSSPDVVSVGATGPQTGFNYPFATPAPAAQYDARASYSNFGPTGVTLWAPGGNSGALDNPRAIVSVCSGHQLGFGAISWGCRNSTRSYYTLQGTSMAAPHAAGLAALIKSRPDFAGPRSNAMRLRIISCMTSTGDALPAGSPFFGQRRINALRATTEPCPAVPTA